MDTMCEAMSATLRADILRIIHKRTSEICVGEFMYHFILASGGV